MTDETSVDEVPCLALSVAGVTKATSIGRTKVYELIGSGQLSSRLLDGRRLILVADLQKFLEALPEADSLKS